MQTQQQICFEVLKVRPLPTGEYELEVLDIEDNKRRSYVFETGCGCGIFAPGFYFFVIFTTQGKKIIPMQVQAYDNPEVCVRKNWSEAMHGPDAHDRLITTPGNTMKYFEAAPMNVKEKAKGKSW